MVELLGTAFQGQFFSFLLHGDAMLINPTVDEIPDHEVRTAVGEVQ